MLSLLGRSLGTGCNARRSVATGELAALGTGGAIVPLRGTIALSGASRALDSFEPDFEGEGRSTHSNICRLDCGIGDGVLGRDFKVFLGDRKGLSFAPVIELRLVGRVTAWCANGEHIYLYRWSSCFPFGAPG